MDWEAGLIDANYYSCNALPRWFSGREFTCNAEDVGSIPGLGRCPGEGKGYALQYSVLQNSMDRIVHGVAKSQTRLSDFHFHMTIMPICLNGEGEK